MEGNLVEESLEENSVEEGNKYPEINVPPFLTKKKKKLFLSAGPYNGCERQDREHEILLYENGFYFNNNTRS